MKNLRIAYVTTYDASDINSWSGLAYYIAQTLDKYVGEVEYIGCLKIKKFIRHYVKKKIYRSIYGKNYYPERTEEMGRWYSRQIENKIKNKNYDLIFSPGVISIAYLNVDIPVAFWADATFSAMIDYYFTDMCKQTIADGNRMEKTALDKCMLAVYSSNWAADSALKDYHANPAKIKVIPFGANIKNIPLRNEIGKSLSKPLQLLYVAKDWERKGGDLVFQTLVTLHEMGIDSQLTVVGCVPPKIFKHFNLVVYPFLDKNDDSDSKKLNTLYRNAHFFILPSRKECFGVVVSEANAFGVPVLATQTGGLPTVVKNGVNGFLLPLEARGTDYAIKIKEVISNERFYLNLRRSSRRCYDEILNWDVAGKHLRDAIYQGI